MTKTNSRRAGGYRGTPERRLQMVIEDARAALGRARELRRRARAGEHVFPELDRESIDALSRAYELRDLAKLGLPNFFTLMMLESEAALERSWATDCLVEEERTLWPAVRSPNAIAEAAEFLVEHAGKPKMSVVEIMEDPAAALRAYRRAAKSLHPDVGGDTRKMQELVSAKGVLDQKKN